MDNIQKVFNKLYKESGHQYFHNIKNIKIKVNKIYYNFYIKDISQDIGDSTYMIYIGAFPDTVIDFEENIDLNIIDFNVKYVKYKCCRSPKFDKLINKILIDDYEIEFKDLENG